MTNVAEKAGRWPPKSCEMPDLSNLTDKNTLGVLLGLFFRKAGPSDYQAKALWVNYIRLVDQVVREYKAAREALQLYVNTPNNVMLPLFQCIGHFESCISLMKRAIVFARRMRRHRGGPQIGKHDVLASAGEKIINFRNAIEHLDDDILKGNVPIGSPIALMVKSDSIELTGNEIYFTDLAKWIQELHKLATDLVNYNEEETVPNK